MIFLDFMLLVILIFINIRIVYFVLLGKLSSFSPITLFCLTVIAQMFPQIAVLYTHKLYDKQIIPLMLFVMITCQIAFNYGFNKGSKTIISSLTRNFKYNKLHYLILILVFCGLLPIPFYSNLDSVYGGINVILGIFRALGTCGFIISLIYLEKFPLINTKSTYAYILLSGLPLLYFAYFIKGSREGIYAFVLITLVFLSRGKFKKNRKIISVLFLIGFIFGSIISSSTTDIRRVNNYKENGATSLENINFIDNFSSSITDRDITNGMDLGNGSILMDYVFQHSCYDYGTEIWNGFIYFFFPSRFFSESIKKSIYINIFNDKGEERLFIKLTNGISTRTGYYTAFKSFSIFAFVVFYLIGLLIGKLKAKSGNSEFSLLIFISCLTIIPNMITHSTQYMFGRLELLLIIFFPLFSLFTAKNIGQKQYEF